MASTYMHYKLGKAAKVGRDERRIRSNNTIKKWRFDRETSQKVVTGSVLMLKKNRRTLLANEQDTSAHQTVHHTRNHYKRGGWFQPPGFSPPVTG
jgi:hypothetical protein